MDHNKVKKYWSHPAEADQPVPRHENDLSAWRESAPDGVRRRSFLKAVGFGVAGLAAQGCQRTPQIKAIPLLQQPPGVTAGRPLYYSTTCGGCSAACGVTAKCRDGRPIKLEGLPNHPLSAGGLCAVGQAALLGLYDQQRVASPQQAGNAIAWNEADSTILTKLKSIDAAGKSICFLSSTINGPTLRKQLAQFLGQFSQTRHVTHDSLSSSAIADAHEQTHGIRALPHYSFDQAEVIASFGADFLGTWLNPMQFTAQRTAGRRLDVALQHAEPAEPAEPGGPAESADATATDAEGNESQQAATPQKSAQQENAPADGSHEAQEESVQHEGTSPENHQPAAEQPSMSYHAQFEPCMTLTGSNADFRMALAPDQVGPALTQLATRISEQTNQPFAGGNPDASPLPETVLGDLADRLVKAAGKSLVISGEQDVRVQKLCNWINQALGNYGQTLDLARPSQIRQGSDRDLASLIEQMKAGQVGALLIHDTNPVFDLPTDSGFTEALANVDLVVQFALRPDETTDHAAFVLPLPHFLESWNDYELRPGLYSTAQPVIQPLFDTRPLLETFNVWCGGQASSLDLIRSHWQSAIFPQVNGQGSFDKFFHRVIRDGWVDVGSEDANIAFNPQSVEPITSAGGTDDFFLVAYPKVGIPDGKHAFNPWLQELPDPVSKATWDNYACLSVATARELGLAEGDVIRLETSDGVAGDPIELPVYVQPGTHDRVVAVALGYGGINTERFADMGPKWIERKPTVGSDGRVGVNIAPLLSLQDNTLRFWRAGVQLNSTGRQQPLACTQSYHRITMPEDIPLMGGQRRPVVQEATFEEFLDDPHAGSVEHHGAHGDGWATLYPNDHPKTGHHWAMSVDLTACTGCSACVVACQAENNVSVVGKDEVRRHREMHWMRIDRYYSGSGDDVQVVHQPMMCQHCDNASCENVCPVLATVHTSEGLNAQVYNRCVGTRYCANNCAYKVRRFNWFYYDRPDELANMALNPDVAVRSRGVMEKCSFCVQRIQEAKIEAKRKGEPVTDEAVQPACQQSCPADAIVFGDINNPASRVSRLASKNPRAFRALEEIGVEPSVYYLTNVRNSSSTNGKGATHHG